MMNHKKKAVLLTMIIMGLFVYTGHVFAVGEDFHIYGGSTTWGFYDSGYSDG